MLVPVPPMTATGVSSHKSAAGTPTASPHHSRKPSPVIPAVPPATTSPGSAGTSSGGGSSWSTGGRVALGTAAVLGVGGAAVGGAILGDHISEHGLDATVDAAGEGLEDFFVDAGEFVVDAAEDVGDFVMDLF